MNSDNNVLMVVAPKDFRDEEYEIPKKIFEESGIGVKVASTVHGECFGVNGSVVVADYGVTEINIDDFSAIVFVGGPGTHQLFGEEGVMALAREFFGSKKYVCAICWAPMILAYAGVLKSGDRVTAWEGAKADLESRGIVYTGEPVTVYGNIITADGPSSADLFGMKITELIIG